MTTIERQRATFEQKSRAILEITLAGNPTPRMAVLAVARAAAQIAYAGSEDREYLVQAVTAAFDAIGLERRRQRLRV